MLTSFAEFKFFQSFRVPVEAVDDVRFVVEYENEDGVRETLEDAKIVDVSTTGLGFSTEKRIAVGTDFHIFINFKRVNLDLSGSVVRSFSASVQDKSLIYGVQIDKDDVPELKRFLEHFINSFSVDRMRDCVLQLALSERYSRASEGFEMFSLILSLFKDMTHFGERQQFLESMLEEVVRVLNAQRASIFLINPDTNELEAVAALGADKNQLRFDYRKGIAGSVFTTGVSLNIDSSVDHKYYRYSEEMDKKTGFKTRSVICAPIHNREDKIIGVLEVLNKRNQDRFTIEDEKVMKVLTLIFSSVFHNYNPISEQSRIRRFSHPFDREYVLIGKSKLIRDLRQSIVKLKDIDAPLFIRGESGVGKTLFARIIHEEGNRGVNPFELVDCVGKSGEELFNEFFGAKTGEENGKVEKCIGGTLMIHEAAAMPIEFQKEFYEICISRKIPHRDLSMDVRFISTSSKDLEKMMDNGEFYKPLYEYLSQSYIHLGALRLRKDDIADLVDYFMRKECKKRGYLLKELSPAVMDAFTEYDWPGNVAELKEAIEKIILYNPKQHIITNIDNSALPILDSRRYGALGSLADIPHALDNSIPLKERMILVEREIILAEIKRFNGNKTKASKEMGISREALRKKMLQSDEVLQQLEQQAQAAMQKKAA